MCKHQPALPWSKGLFSSGLNYKRIIFGPSPLITFHPTLTLVSLKPDGNISNLDYLTQQKSCFEILNITTRGYWVKQEYDYKIRICFNPIMIHESLRWILAKYEWKLY